jgi:4-hydroxy-4-methyl-2-oxoglutarate aldolase
VIGVQPGEEGGRGLGARGDKEAELSGLLLRLGAATLGESGGAPMEPRIKPVFEGASLAGPAFTARCPGGDNLAIHVAVSSAPAGSVLVVDASSLPERGYFGEVLATAAIARGVAGLVMDGGVRDVASLQALGFPVFASSVALRGTKKEGGGEVGAEIEVGGVAVSSGDLVVGDRDGVVLLPVADLKTIIAAAEQRAEKESHLIEELRRGKTTLELFGLDRSLVSELDFT